MVELKPGDSLVLNREQFRLYPTTDCLVSVTDLRKLARGTRACVLANVTSSTGVRLVFVFVDGTVGYIPACFVHDDGRDSWWVKE